MKIIIIADGSLKADKVVFGSWIESFRAKQINDNNHYYYITSVHFSQKNIDFSENNITYLSFKRLFRSPTKPDFFPSKKLYKLMKNINPDVIHIYGTEFSHTYKAYKAVKKLNKLNKTLLSIQGIISEIAKHYTDGIPFFWQLFPSFKDLFKLNNLLIEKLSYEFRGIIERKLIKRFKNIAGRTEFDLNFVKKYGNKDVVYYHVDELLRDTFYNGDKWNLSPFEKNTIFISGSEYPIKGIHTFFKVLPKLIKHYPNIMIKIIGNGPFFGLIHFLKNNSYQNYLKFLIWKLKIVNNVKFIGYFNAEGFKKELLKSNIFLLCSSIENSPNALKEAIQLNVPSITHNVGGVLSVIKGSDTLTYTTNIELTNLIFTLFDQNRSFSDKENASISESENSQSIFKNYISILESLK
jgi:glycosyltransferase involved in cell wall biosynthesis